MAGAFPLHKLVLSEFQAHQSSWKDGLKQIQCTGPEFASNVSLLESIVALFNRERTLLEKIFKPRAQQMRTFIFWRLTKQLVGRLKVLNFDPVISMLQQLHLQLSQGRKTKAVSVPGFVQAFVLHQLRSTSWLCISSCELVRTCYEQYGSMVILSHHLPIALSMMAVFARLTILLSRAAYACATAYNSITQFCNTDPASLPTIAKWDFFVGPVDRELEVPDNVQWEDLAKKMSVEENENQKEIDKLNLKLQQRAEEDEDDLGEELDEALIYKPVPSTKPVQPVLPSPKPVSVTPKPTIPPKVPEKKLESKHIATSSQLDIKHKDKSKDKVKEKLKEKHVEKEKQKIKVLEKPKVKVDEEDDDFGLLWQAPKANQVSKKKDKEKERHKDKASGPKNGNELDESKKRKKQVSAASDDIDDIFGLLTPKSKKSKHH